MARKKNVDSVEKAVDPTKALTKPALAAALSAKVEGLTKAQAASCIDAICTIGEEQLSKGGPGKFVIGHLVTLKTKVTAAKPAKMGRNPRTGEAVPVPAKEASNTVRASAPKTLRKSVAATFVD
jgi:nucleoid DNA-binding protein